MSGVRLRNQGRYEFTYRFRVQASHVNYGGHVGYDAILEMTWEARVHAFRELGITELDLGDGRTGIIMRDLAVNFRGEVFMFDEVLVESHVGEMEGGSFRMFHRLTRADRLVALVEIGFLTFDYATRSRVALPVPFLDALKRHDKRGIDETGNS